MFSELVVLGIRTGTIYRVGLPDGQVTPLYKDAGVSPDGVVVADGTVYWTTMGMPTRDPSVPGEAGLDYSARNGGLHAVSFDGTGARDVVPNGTLTTGKQLAYNGSLYWGDREGCRITRVRPDGTGLTDLIVNEPDDSGMQECVGVTVDATHLYWTQKGPAKGGVGRIFRAGLEIPPGETAGDRSDVETLWDHLPEPIDLEIHGGYLYWTDRGAAPKGNTLNRAPLPGPGRKGVEPEILASGFTEAIGLAVDDEVAYVSDLGGRITAVPLSGGESRVVVDMGELLSGIAGIRAS
ncbi:hypothetical protein [Amycolatopsis circi]|uniref:hypothetical protein n=1 Tax=Amycolatopsis circi TaxID=871959 RepID=UPI000E23DC1A|nr:hypothetical protein [Amycolatopsis circi]